MLTHPIPFLTLCVAFFTLHSHAQTGCKSVFENAAGLSAETINENNRFQSLFNKNEIEQSELRIADIKKHLTYPTNANFNFGKGKIVISEKSLDWVSTTGKVTPLLRNEDPLVQNYGSVFEFKLSPDESKVLVALNKGGDESSWIVISINETPQILTKNPLVVRLSTLRWGQDNKTVYYNHWPAALPQNDKVDPIFSIRAKKIDTTKNDWDQEQIIFQHKEYSELFIHDLDGGNQLIAHGEFVLGTGFGGKVAFSAYLGQRQTDGSYDWQPLVERNKYISQFLGVYKKHGETFALLQTNQFGSQNSIAEVSLKSKLRFSQRVSPLIRGKKNDVLYNSRMVGDSLFLIYQNAKTLEQFVRVVDIKSLKVIHEFDMKSLGFKSNQGLITAPEGNETSALFTYQSVLDGGTFAIDYSFKTNSLKVIDTKLSPYFAEGQLQSKLAYYTFEGKKIPLLLYYLVDKNGQTIQPKFLYQRIYGQLGLNVHNQAEIEEIYGVLALGGAYVLPAIPGGSDLGARWHIEGVQNPAEKTLRATAASLDYVRTKDPLFANFKMPVEKTVLMGRSWGGSLVLAFAALYPKFAGTVISAVPIPDILYGHTKTLTGRPMIVDHLPALNKNGDMIIDEKFWTRLKKTDPMALAKSGRFDLDSPDILIFSGALDDRIGQAKNQTLLNQLLYKSMGPAKTYSLTESQFHGGRWYRKWVWSYLEKRFF